MGTVGTRTRVCHPCHIPRGRARARLCPCPVLAMPARVRALPARASPVTALSPLCHRPVPVGPRSHPPAQPMPDPPGQCQPVVPAVSPYPQGRSRSRVPSGSLLGPTRGGRRGWGCPSRGSPQPPPAAAAPRAGLGSNINRGGLTGHRLSPIVPAGPGGSPPRATPRHKRGGPAAAPQSLRRHHEQRAGGERGHGGARGAHLGGTDTPGPPRTRGAEETPRLSLLGGDIHGGPHPKGCQPRGHPCGWGGPEAVGSCSPPWAGLGGQGQPGGVPRHPHTVPKGDPRTAVPTQGQPGLDSPQGWGTAPPGPSVPWGDTA